MNKIYEISAYSHDEVLNIDLMDPNKYKHIDPAYDFAGEVTKNKNNTIGVARKPAVPVKPAKPVTPPPAEKAAAPAASKPEQSKQETK